MARRTSIAFKSSNRECRSRLLLSLLENRLTIAISSKHSEQLSRLSFKRLSFFIQQILVALKEFKCEYKRVTIALYHYQQRSRLT